MSLILVKKAKPFKWYPDYNIKQILILNLTKSKSNLK